MPATDHELQLPNTCSFLYLLNVLPIIVVDTYSATSLYLKTMVLMVNGYSLIPVVGTLTRNTSCVVGTKSSRPIRSKSSR